MGTTETQRVGIVGTGAMGRPLVDRLLAAGHDVAAYVRRPELRAELSASGVAVVDDAAPQVAAGTLTVFVGGSTDDVARCRAVVGSHAADVVHFGPVGAGQKVKLINNLLFGAHVQLALDAARLSADFGIDVGQLATTLHNCSGASAALDLVAAMGSVDALLSAAGPFIHKDVLVAREVAAQVGASLGTIESVTTPLLEETRP